jgi:hypothetical protein
MPCHKNAREVQRSTHRRLRNLTSRQRQDLLSTYPSCELEKCDYVLLTGEEYVALDLVPHELLLAYVFSSLIAISSL